MTYLNSTGARTTTQNKRVEVDINVVLTLGQLMVQGQLSLRVGKILEKKQERYFVPSSHSPEF